MRGKGIRVDLSEVPHDLRQLAESERSAILARRPIRGPVSNALTVTERELVRCDRTLQNVMSALAGDANGGPIQLAEGEPRGLATFRRVPPPPERVPRRYSEMTAAEIKALPIDLCNEDDPLHPANTGIPEEDLIAEAIRDRRKRFEDALKDREFAQKQAKDHGGQASAYATGTADDPAVRSFAREFGFTNLADAVRLWAMPVDSDERKRQLAEHFRKTGDATKQRDDLRRELADCAASLGDKHPTTQKTKAALDSAEAGLKQQW